MSIAYLCSVCCKTLGMSGFHAVNEVGRKSCSKCGDNDDDLSVVDVEEYQRRTVEIGCNLCKGWGYISNWGNMGEHKTPCSCYRGIKFRMNNM